jgi:hypothetical protein
MSERRIYQVTERDERKAAEKRASRTAELARIEASRADKAYFKRRQTTFGLAKRDASRLALQGDVEWHRGRGQGLLDQLAGLPYSEERLSPAYNAGYHDGYLGSRNEVRGYIDSNTNFDFLREEVA